MSRVFCFMFLLGFVSSVQPAEFPENNMDSAAPFPPDATRELVEAWLHLHDEELCLGINAVFVSRENGIQVWSVVENEKFYKKLLKILQPLSGYGGVEIFAAEAVSQEDSDENGAPPSLWENDELRTFYRVPKRQSNIEILYDWPLGMVTQEEIFIQRLIIFSKQTLEKSEKLRRYAVDLPALTHSALDQELDADLRRLAFKICRQHARGVDKQIDKLKKNLNQALPQGKMDRELPLQDLPVGLEESSPLKLAQKISEQASIISKQVHSFIYPESFTVELDELNSPVILDSLMVLRELGQVYMEKIEREIARF